MIATPEGVDLEIELAGVGSRCAAAALDLILKAVLIVAFVLVGNAALGGSSYWDAIAIASVFLVLFAYDVLFETLAGGRTPGKRALGLRVLLAEGESVGLRASAVRNLLRFVDEYLLLFAPGIISILVTRRNQRLGDLAANALVVRDRAPADVSRRLAKKAAPAGTGPARPDLAAWDVSAVTVDELATVHQFLERRAALTRESRMRLAGQLAERLRGKVAGAPEELPPESFLERLAEAKGARG